MYIFIDDKFELLLFLTPVYSRFLALSDIILPRYARVMLYPWERYLPYRVPVFREDA